MSSLETAESICKRAAELVGGDRQATHGDTVKNHENIALLWTAYKGVAFSPADVALMMALLKIARTKTGSLNMDDFVDLAGYAGVAGEISKRSLDEKK